MHVIPARFFRSSRAINITVVGCGGSGSATASGLPYLHQALRAQGRAGLQVTLVDGDLVSESNCVRQPFSRADIGHFKSVVLATRLNQFWNLAWDAETDFLTAKSDLRSADVVIGCVDQRSARGVIRDLLNERSNVTYWLDLGNDATGGQFVLGQPLNMANPRKADRLRTVAELYPEICDPTEEDESLPSCSAIEALTKQQPFVNQVLAMHALALLSRLFWDGQVAYHGGFMNLETGKVTPLPVDPEQWKRLSKWNKKIAA